MKKKMLALAICLCLMLCACAAGQPDAQTGPAETAAASTAAAVQNTQARPQETEAPATAAAQPAQTEPPKTEPPETEPANDAFAQAQTCVDQSVDALYALIGQPESSDYAPSCLGSGEDGNLYYDGFTVYTYREGNEETVRFVEQNS